MKFVEDVILVTWSMTTVCNYKCSYCPSNLHDGAYKFPSDTQNIINFLNDIQNKNREKKIFMTILGGEPMLWPKFDTFLQKLNENIYVEVLTNGSRNLSWWSNNINLINRLYNLVLTFHPEHADKDEFLKVCKYLSEKSDILIQVNIMALPGEKFNDCIEVYEKLRETNNLSVRVKAIRKDFGDQYLKEYSKDELETIKTSHKYNIKDRKELFDFDSQGFYNLSFNKKNTWKNQLCHIGVDSFFIEYDGSIYRGTCKVGGAIGKLGDYILPTVGVICNKNLCPCVTDALIKKEKL